MQIERVCMDAVNCSILWLQVEEMEEVDGAMCVCVCVCARVCVFEYDPEDRCVVHFNICF
jgi:hypothetical protein